MILPNGPATVRFIRVLLQKTFIPGVDVRFYTDKGNMKYDIIVKPGADASKIVMRYSGADNLELRDKQLVIKTSVVMLKNRILILTSMK
jgi:hypothetical protein